MPTDDQTFLKEFYQALRDRPLAPDSPCYVRLYDDEELTPTDPVDQLQTTIEWSPIESTQLFSGFRGTGKSTELRRLKHQLEQAGESIVVLCDMGRYLNLTTPVDVSDFLLAIAGALGDALQGDPDLLGKDLLQEGYWTRFCNFMTRTRVEPAELGLEGGVEAASVSVKANLKADPTFRQRLQDHLKGHLGALVADVRTFTQECVEALQDRHGADTRVVLLLDSVEQIRGTAVNAEDVAASLVVLFHGHADKLVFPYLHVVYTVPPWLKIKEPGISRLYDGSEWIPCVKVADREGQPCEAGLRALREVVGHRGDWQRLLGSQDALDQLILASGGYLRDLFRLLQTTLRLARGRSLPVSKPILDLAKQEVRNAYLPVAHEDALWLDRIHATRATELEDGTHLPDLARYFDNLLVMAYRNGDEWWAVHPLIADTVRAQAAEVRKRRQQEGAATDGGDGAASD
ncbi:MAG: hypothetical protein D6798_10840 [Deltaproteobacteria bacterium]|nr:MAG: hypothetical protein D6798_10840 [Deltaproteobacteria bacterium]